MEGGPEYRAALFCLSWAKSASESLTDMAARHLLLEYRLPSNPAPLEGIRMGVLSIDIVASVAAIFIGLILIVGALYPQRGGQLRYRQGAKVLLGFGVLIGIAILMTGAFLLIRTLAAGLF